MIAHHSCTPSSSSPSPASSNRQLIDFAKAKNKTNKLFACDIRIVWGACFTGGRGVPKDEDYTKQTLTVTVLHQYPWTLFEISNTNTDHLNYLACMITPKADVTYTSELVTCIGCCNNTSIWSIRQRKPALLCPCTAPAFVELSLLSLQSPSASICILVTLYDTVGFKGPG